MGLWQALSGGFYNLVETHISMEAEQSRSKVLSLRPSVHLVLPFPASSALPELEIPFVYTWRGSGLQGPILRIFLG